MTTVLITMTMSFVIILLVIAGMSLGVINGRKPISGSCGGLNGSGCEFCSDSNRCERDGDQQ